MSKLIWCRYEQAPGKATNRLLMVLGTKGHLMIALDSNMLSREETTLIRQASNLFAKLDVDEKVTWLKENAPSTMKALRSFKEAQVMILKEYPLKPL